MEENDELKGENNVFKFQNPKFHGIENYTPPELDEKGNPIEIDEDSIKKVEIILDKLKRGEAKGALIIALGLEGEAFSAYCSEIAVENNIKYLGILELVKVWFNNPIFCKDEDDKI